jgi:hypothetical protein
MSSSCSHFVLPFLKLILIISCIYEQKHNMSTEKYKAKKSDFNNIFNQLSFPDGH